MRGKSLVIFFLAIRSFAQSGEPDIHRADLIIYGGTASAVIAAVQASRMQRSVIMVSPDRHLGGLSSGGLGWTDTGNKQVIEGMAREFYHRVYQKYQDPEAWKWQGRLDYGNRGQGTPAIDGNQSSYIAFGSIRMEPVFMILGQRAATAAVMAIDKDQGVQEIDYEMLLKQLLKNGQVISL